MFVKHHGNVCVHTTRISIRGMGLGLRLGVVSHVDREILAILYTAASAPRHGLRKTVSKNDLHAPAKIGKINAPLRIDLYPRGFTFRRTIVLCMGATVTMTIRDCVNDCRRWKRFYIIICFSFLSPAARRAQWKAVGVDENGGHTPLVFAAYTKSG